MTTYTVIWDGSMGPLTESAGWSTRGSYLTDAAILGPSPTLAAKRAAKCRDVKFDAKARRELLATLPRRECTMHCGRLIGASDTWWGFARCSVCRGKGTA